MGACAALVERIFKRRDFTIAPESGQAFKLVLILIGGKLVSASQIFPTLRSPSHKKSISLLSRRLPHHRKNARGSQ
jgi:hypothetical protein